MESKMTKQKILLTGANGQLGRAIQKEYGDAAEFIRTDMIEGEGLLKLDISDLSAVRKVIAETKPDMMVSTIESTAQPSIRSPACQISLSWLPSVFTSLVMVVMYWGTRRSIYT